MESVPLWVQVIALVALTATSAFFSISETALMALNRHRIKHLARRGSRLAQTTLWLLDHTDRMLSLILIANTLDQRADHGTGYVDRDRGLRQ